MFALDVLFCFVALLSMLAFIIIIVVSVVACLCR